MAVITPEIDLRHVEAIASGPFVRVEPVQQSDIENCFRAGCVMHSILGVEVDIDVLASADDDPNTRVRAVGVAGFFAESRNVELSARDSKDAYMVSPEAARNDAARTLSMGGAIMRLKFRMGLQHRRGEVCETFRGIIGQLRAEQAAESL